MPLTNTPNMTGAEASDELAYTVLEAAAKARVPRALLYRHIGEGRLIAHKIGSRTIVLRMDLIAYLQDSPRILGTCKSAV